MNKCHIKQVINHDLYFSLFLTATNAPSCKNRTKNQKYFDWSYRDGRNNFSTPMRVKKNYKKTRLSSSILVNLNSMWPRLVYWCDNCETFCLELSESINRTKLTSSLSKNNVCCVFCSVWIERISLSFWLDRLIS